MGRQRDELTPAQARRLAAALEAIERAEAAGRDPDPDLLRLAADAYAVADAFEGDDEGLKERMIAAAAPSG